MLNFSDNKGSIRTAILRNVKIRVWVKDTPENSGHTINPYEILEDAKMIAYIYGLNEEQNRLILTKIDAISRVEILNETFAKPGDWSANISLVEYSISKK